MIERAILTVPSDAEPAGAMANLVALSERLARARRPEAIFDAFAGFVAAEGLGASVLDVRSGARRNKRQRWTTFAEERLALFDKAQVEPKLAELLQPDNHPRAVAWSCGPGAGRQRIEDYRTRERLHDIGIGGGIHAQMALPSGRGAVVHALAAPGEYISDFTRDLFLVAAIQTFLAIDRSLGAMPAVDLTRRELEVLQLAAQGLSDRQVAAALVISEPTAKFHLAGARRKLNAKTTKEAIAALSADWRLPRTPKPSIEMI